MTIQELGQNLLSLEKSDRQHLADLLNHSLLDKPVPSTGLNRFDIQQMLMNNSDQAWNQAQQKLQMPVEPTSLAKLLQSWEDEGDEQEQKENWEFLQ